MTTIDASPPLALTMGDPAGCGPAITHAAWQALRAEAGLAFYVIGAPSLYADFGPVAAIASPGDAAGAFQQGLPVLDAAGPLNPPRPGEPDPASASAILASIERAAAHACGGDASGVVTNPISKALLYAAGFDHPGHTEFLAALTAPPEGPAPQPVMMLVGGGLRVALATIHLPLAQAITAITRDRLTRIAEVVDHALRCDFAVETPRLAFSGLNPHAGEDGTLGREEIDVINPAAEALRASGIDISDARPGDTVFAEALADQYDAVIAMTHDQGLIPVKTLDFWGGVNTTLGLPIVRTSPDHGTAYDAARAGTARPDSLIAAIRLAATLARNRVNAPAGA